MRSRVLFHNSVDIWIGYCTEKNIPWNEPGRYREFMAYLRRRNLNLKAFNLCAHESGEGEQDKKKFAEVLADLKNTDPNYATYTIRLSNNSIDAIRAYKPA